MPLFSSAAGLGSGSSIRALRNRLFCRRTYASSALALRDFEEEEDEWRLPLPVLQDSYGQRNGRGPQLVFLGSPAAGKAAYASRLAKLLNVPHISMGSLLRKEAATSSAFSKELARLSTNGKLVPDDLIFRMLSRGLEQKPELEESGFILEGFPRTVHQAEVLDAVAEIDLVIHMKLREDMLLKCAERGVCTECGFSASSGLEFCLKGRSCPLSNCLLKRGLPVHETLLSLRQRLHAYYTQSKPIEYYYHKQDKLLDIEVQGGLPQTWHRLLSVLRIEDNDAMVQQKLPV